MNNFLMILVGLVFTLLGLWVVYKGIRNTRSKGIGDGFVDFVIGIGLVILGLLIWSGF
jgi:hypothetical protein